MSTLVHLLDDVAFGGVTRFVEALTARLGTNVQQMCRSVQPLTERPPRLDHDIVVVHFTASWRKLPYLIGLRALRGSRPIVIMEHSYTDAYERHFVTRPRRFRVMLRIAYGLADRVVAVSYAQGAWMRRARLLTASKLVVIPPFTDCGALTDVALPVSNTAPLRLGAYGRYCQIKGFDTLIAAMRQVGPDVATLDLRGFGPDAEALGVQAAEMPHVTIGGKVDDLVHYLKGIDAVVVPSRQESFGQVALEARLAGRPVIVTNVGGLPEQVEPAHGVVVPANDPGALAEAIEALAETKRRGQLPAMSASARQSAAEHFLTSSTRWLTLIQDLLIQDLAKPANRPIAGTMASARA